ncbi:Odorant receptor 4 [Eumeta japonica]|uniref:Odorant receptor 4 n=1 Tax=Eumeta variegata TaxID=151549 RepID=A0A4C1TC90_EUMVA|nr:Odorant receptor 4 [Eumeta japonica]
MSEETLRELAHREISESLYLSNFCMHRIGLSFESKKSFFSYVWQKVLFALSFASICYHVFSEITYISITLVNSPRVEEVVPLLHTFGYGLLSIAKVLAIWYKLDVFAKLLTELVDIWPVPPLDPVCQKIKDNSLSGLRTAHRWYFVCNVAGVWFYNLTPLGIYFYRLWQQKQAEVGFVWVSWYPFNKHHPVAHVFVYLFEMFAGQTCVWIMVCSDLLFTAMASHISMLLRILQLRLHTLGVTSDDHYRNLIDNVKLHQRLIRHVKKN